LYKKGLTNVDRGFTVVSNMEMTQSKCTEKGCDFVASHANQAVANRMLGMHKRHKHGILGRLAKYNKPKSDDTRCSQPGCEYTFSHDNPIVLKRTMALHMSKAHGIRSENAIKNEKYNKNRKRRPNRQNGELVTAVAIRANSLPPVIHDMQPRNGHAHNGHTNGHRMPNFEDENDGFDYKAMLVELLERFPCCPSCGTNVGEYQQMLLAKIRHDQAHA
jgi:hypothetical protein